MDMLGKRLGIYTEGRDLTNSDGSLQKPTTINLVAKPIPEGQGE